MAATSDIDDVDLIDLGSGLSISRRRRTNSSNNDVPLTNEEQEHLLDVCPPKLEQKLSLSLKQKGDYSVRRATTTDNESSGHNGDVLVTLGHDKVVPIAKRIDVVSSDTIKRVKDITKNLEPVIQKVVETSNFENGNDQVDNCAAEDTETFETQEINNAFNFLTELDDYDDEDEDLNRLNESVSSDGPLIREDEFSKRLIGRNNFGHGADVLFKARGNHGAENEDKVLMTRSYSRGFSKNSPKNRVGDFENFGFELSPTRHNRTLPRNFQNKFSNGKNVADNKIDPHPVAGGNRASKSQSLRRASLRVTSPASNYDYADVHRRRSLRNKMQDRKSWSEGLVGKRDADNNTNFGRATSLHIDDEKPSTSNPNRVFIQRSEVSVRTKDEDSCSETSSSASASDVDWSWVEEVESSRGKVQQQLEQSSNDTWIKKNVEDDNDNDNGNDNDNDNDKGKDKENDSEVEDSEGTTIPSNNSELNSVTTTSVKRMRQPGNTANNSTDSIVMTSGLPTAKVLPVAAGCPGPPGQASNEQQNYSNNNTNPTSWVRASMRRLRHLRLPDAETALASTSSYQQQDIQQHQHQQNSVSGTNSLPDIALIAPDILAAQTNGSVSGDSGVGVGGGGGLRPASAPTPRGFGNVPTSPGRGRLTGGRSRGRNTQGSRRSSLQSRNTSSDTSCSSSSATSTVTSPASSPNPTPQHPASSSFAVRRVCERQRGADRDDERSEDEDEEENPLGRWPHALSPALACLGCTLGLFNISRFATLSIQFGANFIVQFLVLSLVLGIPLFTLQVCLGQRLAAGAVDMWKISPLFQGVGIALLTAQAFIGIYSIVGISWMFVYFRDSFITKLDKYGWAEPFQSYRDDSRPAHNTTTYKLHETVPDYFHLTVLQRHDLNESETGIVTLKFQVAFNLAVVWMIVFVSLSKGLRSYGKVVYVFTLVPVFGTLILCAKLLGLTPTGSIHQLFPATVWSEFFINGKSWMAASSEVFLTWGLFGAAAMQIAAHNKHKHLLQRDTSLVVVLTFVVLLLSAFLANTCVQILRHHGYLYTTSSFERISGYTFMHLVNQPLPQSQSSAPERFMNHASFLVGQRVARPGADLSEESGYQVLRLATELVPATLAILGSEQVSPFWAVLFYFILILFGIAQQLAIWHCVITGIMAINTKMMKLWETTITFFSCACGYILGLPMATEFGIYVVYYLDYTVGGAWWIMVLYLVEVGAVFAVRGRPHTGEAVVAELFPPTGRCLRHWAGPLLSFTWNVVLPVALMVLSIMIFKSTGFRDLYTYRRTGREYWSVWARQLGAAIQLIPILTIPVVAIVQTCRYLNSGPPDIFDVRVRNEQVEVNVSHCAQCNGRIQLLYRPSLEPDDPADPQTQIGADATTSIHGNGILPSTTDVPFEDPPPKYTPPPSYTTATGARIAKMLRQSFRRSVRRIANVLGESSTPRTRPALQPPPPDYATVLVEMNQGIPSTDISIIVTEAGPDVTDLPTERRNSVERRRPNTIDRTMRISTIDRTSSERSHSTMDRGRRTHTNNGSSNLTAADVANLLRSSIRRGTSRNHQSLHGSFANEPTAAVSIQNLVEGAAPIGQDSLVLPKDESLVFEQDINDDKKTADDTENATTVI